LAQLTGAEIYSADYAPADALWLRAVRSPHHSATYTLGSFDGLHEKYPGLVRVLTAADVPGINGYGVYPDVRDQPVLADGEARFRGEAVVALIGDYETVFAIRDEEVPIEYAPREAILDMDAAAATGAHRIHKESPGNIMCRGYCEKGDQESAFAECDVVVEDAFETGFVEHGYIEPDAGWAIRVGDRLEIHGATQAPYTNLEALRHVIGVEADGIRIVPTAIGGGFGGKLDLNFQPLVGVAAWVLGRAVRTVFNRHEVMAATGKRHPSRIRAKFGCTRDGKLRALEFHGDFKTGAYIAFGRTVADRVPIHSTGPYFCPHVKATSTAFYSNEMPATAFRGFGTPQAALAHEALMDDMAEKLGMDALEFRHLNALRKGDLTITEQKLEASAGLDQCLDGLRPHWQAWRKDSEAFNRAHDGPKRRGTGIGCMWYGCGNTSMPNPSTIHMRLRRDGRVTVYSGAIDMGQGPNTTIMQMGADGLGIEMSRLSMVNGDTDLTADAGKSSASRVCYVSGNAVKFAGEDLRSQILRLANVGEEAEIEFGGTELIVREGSAERKIDLAALPADDDGVVLSGEGYFTPPTTMPENERGTGVPYATYAFAAQMAEVEVDVELGTVKVLRIAAAHDVGKAINPLIVEGQIHGGIAQGLGMALMEEYIPGKTEDLHNYLMPTFGDVPEITSIIVEDPEPTGPWGAKGIGEPALIPTLPAIFGAIYHATGVRMKSAPATPDKVRRAILELADLELADLELADRELADKV
jgi:CO/xanthine dehydrogenase Mo-binding subunit